MIGGLLLLLLLKEVKYGHNIEINIENEIAPKVYAPIAVSPIAVSNSENLLAYQGQPGRRRLADRRRDQPHQDP